MNNEGKKQILELPLKLVLSEQGSSSFLGHNKKLLKFRLADNTEEYGVSLNKFSPQSLQNMIMIDYISKIEISKPEFVSSRQDIMDLAKLIVYSLLYKQFDTEIFKGLIACDCVKKHNRTNPSQLIDEKTSISQKQLRVMLQSKNSDIEKARKTILEPVWKSFLDKKDITPEEKNVYLLMTEKFLNRLSLLNWYIILKFQKTDSFPQFLVCIRNILGSYIEKSKVPEYIALMIMELALHCENANIRKEAQTMYQGVDDINEIIYDPESRAKIVEELTRKHELVFISWKIGGGSFSIGKKGQLQITLYNKEDEFQEVKENIETKMSADLSKQSLIDFYREIPEGEGETDLGLYYLSYLDEACKKVGVKFESLVNQFSASDLTVINLIFNF